MPPVTTTPSERVCVGVITGSHGVRGALRIKSFTAEPAHVAAYGKVTMGEGPNSVVLRVTGQAKGVPMHTVYSGSKGTIETFVRCMAIDCGDKRITVNCVAPGGIKTDMYEKVSQTVPLTPDPMLNFRSGLQRIYPRRPEPHRRASRRLRRHLVAAEPRRQAHRRRPRRRLPRQPGRGVDQRQGLGHRRRRLHVGPRPRSNLEVFTIDRLMLEI